MLDLSLVFGARPCCFRACSFYRPLCLELEDFNVYSVIVTHLGKSGLQLVFSIFPSDWACHCALTEWVRTNNNALSLFISGGMKERSIVTDKK